MSKKPKDQHFGGIWTAEKLEAVHRYLEAYTQALKNQPFELIYIDAFAGNGFCHIGEKDVFSKKLDGSALNSLKTSHPFNRLIFIENDINKSQELQARCELSDQNHKIKILCGDANQELEKISELMKQKNKRGVLFLDPYGASVTWQTLKMIAETKHLDVWYLFPISAIIRFAAKDFDKALDEKIDQTLGTTEWREWYKPQVINQDRLIDAENHPQKIRHYISKEIPMLFKKNLESIFSLVLDPVIIKNSHNTPMFALYFACSSNNNSAKKTAEKIAKHILKMFADGRLAPEIKQEQLDAKLKAKKHESGMNDLFD